MRQYVDSVQGQLQPKYHELTAYLAALTCALLFIFYSEFRRGYFEILYGARAGRAMPTLMLLTAIATLGFLFSFIQVFIKRKKSWFEKTCMGVFVMGASGFAGIAAGMDMLPSPWSLMAVIAIWNIFMGVILLYQIGLQKFDITNEDASRVETIGATVILLIIFAIAKFGFHLTWAITFSICIFYSSTILFLVNWTIRYFELQPLSPK